MFNRVLLYIISAVLLALCGLVAYQVFARYIPFIPPYLWTEEVSRGLLIWLVMLGAGYGFAKQEHFQMTAFTESLAGVKARLSHFFINLVVFICGILMTLSGIEFVERGAGRISFASGLPLIWVYSALIAGGILMVIGSGIVLWTKCIKNNNVEGIAK